MITFECLDASLKCHHRSAESCKYSIDLQFLEFSTVKTQCLWIVSPFLNLFLCKKKKKNCNNLGTKWKCKCPNCCGSVAWKKLTLISLFSFALKLNKLFQVLNNKMMLFAFNVLLHHNVLKLNFSPP